MRQRAALARTLMEDQDLVLLDEPFSALDARTRCDMQELAFDILSGRTVMLVTHDPAEAARMADRIYLFTEGGLSEFPAPASASIRALDDAEAHQTQLDLYRKLRRP